MEGNSSSRKGRGGRPILSPKSVEQAPENSSQQPCNEQEDHSEILDAIQAFEAMLLHSRSDWSIRQAKRGLFSSRKLDKADADRALKRELAKLSEGGVE
jgi:hypothetical protein